MSSHPHSVGYDQDGNPVSAVDWLGNRFHVGDKVMYCIGAGRGQMMAVGTLLKIEVATHVSPIYRDGQLRREWEEVTCQVLTSRTSGQWNNKARTKPAWVNPMNITALPVTL